MVVNAPRGRAAALALVLATLEALNVELASVLEGILTDLINVGRVHAQRESWSIPADLCGIGVPNSSLSVRLLFRLSLRNMISLEWCSQP